MVAISRNVAEISKKWRKWLIKNGRRYFDTLYSHPCSSPLQIEEENAALLAALTDSLDGMVDAEVDGLSVFPTLGEEPDQEEEEDDGLPLTAENFSQSLGARTEDPSPSLVRTPLCFL